MRRIPPDAAAGSAPSPRAAIRRRSGRARYDRPAVDAILDAGLVGHCAIVSEGQPYSIPMLYARDGDRLLLHGAPLSRLLRTLTEGVPMSFSVAHVDGVVLARSWFHHSVNYRSVVILGEGRALTGPEEKLAALERLVDRVMPGRSADSRGPKPGELTATEVIALDLAEASAKVRSGPPADAPEDRELPVWAGEVPLALAAGTPVPDAGCGVPVPGYLARYLAEFADEH